MAQNPSRTLFWLFPGIKFLFVADFRFLGPHRIFPKAIFNPNLGGILGVRFEMGGGGFKITPPTCLKLVRIMLET